MRRIALISCVSKKRTGQHKAKDLYISDLFRKSYRFTSARYDQVFILSAKYGLVASDDLIESYDLTLNRMSATERRDWACEVMSQLSTRITLEDHLYFYCGARYREYLIQWLPNVCHAPLLGKPIGKQLQFYKGAG